MTDKIVVLHHEDHDGICAGWIIDNHYRVGHQDVDITTIPVQYNRPFPGVVLDHDTILYIVDFSYPREQLLELQSRVKEIHVFDHHDTARKELAGLDFAVFSDQFAGAGLTWNQLYPHAVVPDIVQLVDDYDLWLFKHGDRTRAFHLGLRYFNVKTVPDFRTILEPARLSRCFEMGRLLLEIQTKQVDTLVNNPLHVTEYFQNQCVVFNNVAHFNEVASTVLSTLASVDMVMNWFLVPDEDKIVFSFRTNAQRDIHLGDGVCKLYGGGGHKNAAGFSLSLKTGEGLELIAGIYTR